MYYFKMKIKVPNNIVLIVSGRNKLILRKCPPSLFRLTLFWWKLLNQCWRNGGFNDYTNFEFHSFKSLQHQVKVVERNLTCSTFRQFPKFGTRARFTIVLNHSLFRRKVITLFLRRLRSNCNKSILFMGSNSYFTSIKTISSITGS